MSDISKLLYVISWAVRRVKSETILKYHEWYLCHISLEIMLLFVYTTTHTRFVIFKRRYSKLSWNTTALSQSNCKNFSCSSIKAIIAAARIIQIALHDIRGVCIRSSWSSKRILRWLRWSGWAEQLVGNQRLSLKINNKQNSSMSKQFGLFPSNRELLNPNCWPILCFKHENLKL